MLDFTGRVAVVTGAGGGLGMAYARHLAAGGASVLVSDNGRTLNGESKAESFAAELVGLGLTAIANVGSVAVEREAEGIVEQAIRDFGRIDILINNAGNAIGGRLQEITTEQFDQVMRVHLYGTFWTMRAALKAMRAARYGRIVNTTSAVGAFGLAGTAPYASAKAGIIGLTKVAALENLTANIRVNAIAPFASTALAEAFFNGNPTIDSSRLKAELVVPPVAYLCHEECSITGKILTSAGGRTSSFFQATAPGLRDAELTDEKVGAHLAQILGHDAYVVPSSAMDEFDLLDF